MRTIYKTAICIQSIILQWSNINISSCSIVTIIQHPLDEDIQTKYFVHVLLENKDLTKNISKVCCTGEIFSLCRFLIYKIIYLFFNKLCLKITKNDVSFMNF